MQYARVLDWCIFTYMILNFFLNVILSIMCLFYFIEVLCVCRERECWCSRDILHICHNSAYGVWCCERQAVVPDAILLSSSVRLLYRWVRE